MSNLVKAVMFFSFPTGTYITSAFIQIKVSLKMVASDFGINTEEAVETKRKNL